MIAWIAHRVGQPSYWLALLATITLAGCNTDDLFVKEDPATVGDLLNTDPLQAAFSDAVSDLPEHNDSVRESVQRTTPVTGPAPATGRGLVEEVRLGGTVPSPAGGVETGEPTAGAPDDEPQGSPISLDFADVSLRELVQVIFDEYLKVPYTILEDFKDKKVNFVYRAIATREEMLTALDAFLSFHGVSMAYSGGVYAITTESNLKGQPAVDDIGTVAGVFQLSHLDAQEFVNIARQFVDQPTQVLELNQVNAAFVSAPTAQFKAVEMLYERLDVPYFDGKYLLVYVPRYLSANALKELIDNYGKMLGISGKPGGRLFEVEAVKELGQVVIVAANREARDLVVQFLNANDEEQGNARRIFQYVLTNQQANEAVGSVKGLVKALFNDETRAEVIADKTSNSLFISATPEDFVEIVNLIRRLDFRPPAVHVDVTLAEVVLNDSMRYGVEWFLFQDSGDTRGSGQLDLGQDSDRGLVLDLVNLSNDKFLTLELLASKTDFTILANPQVVVKNGSTATIIVGSEIAIEKATLQTDTAGSSTQTEFDRRDVAIRVEATPTIGADRQIQIDLRVVDERDVGRDINGQPIFAKRELNTELVAYDGDTLFMGGIIRNRKVQQREEVPIVGDLRYVGEFLFGNDRSEVERTELIMLVTPRLLLDNEGANILTNALVGAALARLDDGDGIP